MMFQRRQSIRYLFGNGFRKQAMESATEFQKVDHKKQDTKKRRDSLLQIMRRRRKHNKTPLQHCMETIEKNWNAPGDYDKDENFKITTPDGRFLLIVSSGKTKGTITSKSSSLSISTRIYTCTSDVQSTAVVRKAMDIQDLVGGSDDEDYELVIDPDPSSSSHHNAKSNLATLPIQIALCFSCSMVGLFNSNSNSSSDTDDDTLFSVIKDFVKVAFSVQTKLESVDEGRLGMTPMPRNPNNDVTINTSHVEFLTNPPSIVEQFMRTARSTADDVTAPDSTSVSLSSPVFPVRVDSANQRLFSTTMTDSCHIRSLLSSRERSLIQTPVTSRNARSKSERRLKRSSTKSHSRSARNILSQFSTPEEARVFELYAKQKSKRRAAKRHKRIEKDPTRAAKIITANSTNTSPPPIILPSDQLSKRMNSLPVRIGKQNSASVTNGVVLAPPAPPVSSDWNKTPVISNKGFIRIANENTGTNKAIVSKKVPFINEESPTPTYLPKVISNNVGKEEVKSVEMVSERHLLNETNTIGGSTASLIKMV